MRNEPVPVSLQEAFYDMRLVPVKQNRTDRGNQIKILLNLKPDFDTL